MEHSGVSDNEAGGKSIGSIHKKCFDNFDILAYSFIWKKKTCINWMKWTYFKPVFPFYTP